MINKVILLGRLVADPEVKFMPNGGQVTTLRLVTNRRYKDKSGQTQEESEFHRVVFFGKLAEIAGNYLKKGSQAFIQGRIKTTKYQAKDGTERSSTEIHADEMQMISGNSEPKSQPQRPVAKNNNYDDDVVF